MHTIILGLLICVFVYFGFYTQYESFGPVDENTTKNSIKLALDEISKTNDASLGLVEFSLVPFSSASKTVSIGLRQNPKNVKIPLVRKINSYTIFGRNQIVGIKVPDGIKVTIYESLNQKGYSNSIIGPNTIDSMETARNLQYPETEDDEGNLLPNNFGGKGWQNRVQSFTIHRYKDIPDEFDSVFYTKKYQINDYDKYINEGGDLTNVAEKTKEGQWQHFLDIGESLGYAINRKAALDDKPIENNMIE